jgi:hypothetical protein
MLGLAVGIGLIGGAWIGRDLRKEWAKRGGDEEDDRSHIR